MILLNKFIILILGILLPELWLYFLINMLMSIMTKNHFTEI